MLVHTVVPKRPFLDFAFGTWKRNAATFFFAATWAVTRRHGDKTTQTMDSAEPYTWRNDGKNPELGIYFRCCVLLVAKSSRKHFWTKICKKHRIDFQSYGFLGLVFALDAPWVTHYRARFERISLTFSSNKNY